MPKDTVRELRINLISKTIPNLFWGAALGAGSSPGWEVRQGSWCAPQIVACWGTCFDVGWWESGAISYLARLSLTRGVALLPKSQGRLCRRPLPPGWNPHAAFSVPWLCFRAVSVAKRKGRIRRLGHFHFFGWGQKAECFCPVTQAERARRLVWGVGGRHCLVVTRELHGSAPLEAGVTGSSS